MASPISNDVEFIPQAFYSQATNNHYGCRLLITCFRFRRYRQCHHWPILAHCTLLDRNRQCHNKCLCHYLRRYRKLSMLQWPQRSSNRRSSVSQGRLGTDSIKIPPLCKQTTARSALLTTNL
ncbi:uncharacterized protein L969DRAFT_92772 [Mixia osmundae IAM 14324]|uniref:Uncharacterized protein n=1 Tax=Mixia osmundae (strain CBS 9802 / IAM 14324 / JCM 22182 / KY 12970) TaxID=764103 RepID=G7DYI3_MIXOS|nr:uncharacterized protein L969DRAFT_92772 [Mixia osmundae IAM 14324]KEI41544.1 hypothetical protein L969DRAFT_92772 [Mixia osmundae IAM 14324]GAA95643.1 hypothetical protein E5Q_02299 [Mixia osmundae IAM 14324]